jgi:hypothetical protein
MEKEIIEFFHLCEEDIKNNDINQGDYCIILYAGKTYTSRGMVKFIYKNTTEFKNKATKDISTIDNSVGLDLEMWIYD